MSPRETLVLLPGLLCDRAVWQAQIAALTPQVDCHVVHYGTLDDLGAMARHVLDTAPAPRFSLAGHSMGGRVAFEVWRQAPERVQRLALLDTASQPLAEGEAGATEKRGRLALLDKARQQGMRAMADAWARGMVHASRIGGPVFDTILDMFERSSPEVFAAQVKALLNRPDATPLLPTITCPTLLPCGRDDAWSPPERHEAMQQAIAGATLSVLEQCGHMSTLEQPEAVNRALAEWLARPAP